MALPPATFLGNVRQSGAGEWEETLTNKIRCNWRGDFFFWPLRPFLLVDYEEELIGDGLACVFPPGLFSLASGISCKRTSLAMKVGQARMHGGASGGH